MRAPLLFAHSDQDHDGGAEHVLALCARRAAASWSVELALMHEGGRRARLDDEPAFARVHRLGFPRGLGVDDAARSLGATRRLAALAKSAGACLSFSWPAAVRLTLATALAPRARLGWVCQGELARAPSPKRELALRMVAARTRVVVTPSEAVRRQLLAVGFGPERVRVIRLGVDVARFRPMAQGRDERAALREELGLEGAGFWVVCVARLDDNKRQTTLIQAVAAARRQGLDARLVCVGEAWGDDAREQTRLMRIAEALGVGAQVRLVGPKDDVRPWLAMSDVVALASRREAAGMVLDEAAAMARPVVATRVGGTPEAVVHGETGLLFEPDDAEACARHWLTLAAEPGRARAMGERARARVERACASAAAGAWEALFETLVR